jgi:hypothetical protein
MKTQLKESRITQLEESRKRWFGENSGWLQAIDEKQREMVSLKRKIEIRNKIIAWLIFILFALFVAWVTNHRPDNRYEPPPFTLGG